LSHIAQKHPCVFVKLNCELRLNADRPSLMAGEYILADGKKVLTVVIAAAIYGRTSAQTLRRWQINRC